MDGRYRGELIDANVRLRLTANRTYEITAPKSTVSFSTRSFSVLGKKEKTRTYKVFHFPYPVAHIIRVTRNIDDATDHKMGAAFQ